MTDLVVTVPKHFWRDWIEEGDAAGEPETGEEWGFHFGYQRPPATAGARLYIVAWNRLRGYAPITRIAEHRNGTFSICRQGDAVACTIDPPIKGFRGWRCRWWNRTDERPFPHWRTEGVA